MIVLLPIAFLFMLMWWDWEDNKKDDKDEPV